MREVVIAKIQINERQEEQLIFLKEKDGARAFPMVVGIVEAQAIRLQLSGFVPQRPLTHDLLSLMIGRLGAQVVRVVIDRFEEHTFYAKIVLTKENDREVIVDARPSDGIALAVRVHAPIFAEDLVLETAGIN